MSTKMFPENASDAKKIVTFKQIVYNYRRYLIQAFKMGQEKRRTMTSMWYSPVTVLPSHRAAFNNKCAK